MGEQECFNKCRIKIAITAEKGDGGMDQAEKQNKMAAFAVEGMLYEVTATPKPGLVDRVNNGAHYDMDYFTFMSSAAALHTTFDEMVSAGVKSGEQNENIRELLPALREIGKQAEDGMFAFTDGVNTHKGMIFSLGVLCGCAGWLIGRNEKLSPERICECAREMCRGLCEQDFAHLKEKKVLSKGERMYLRYGYKGVRGVAESGYQIVRRVSLPVYTRLRESGVSINEALVHTLLYLIKDTKDTNIVSRHDRKTAVYASKYAAFVLKAGGMGTRKGRAAVKRMDRDFIKKYISPGGCADLLAVTHFLYCVNEENGVRLR